MLNALGYVCGGPLPNQVLLSRWFDEDRGKAMGFAYLGIGIGGALVPLVADGVDERVRLARRAADPRRADDRDRAADGVVRQGRAGRTLAGRRRQAPQAHRQPRTGAGCAGTILRTPAFYLLVIG